MKNFPILLWDRKLYEKFPNTLVRQKIIWKISQYSCETENYMKNFPILLWDRKKTEGNLSTIYLWL